jgi:hypothetical protein
MNPEPSEEMMADGDQSDQQQDGGSGAGAATAEDVPGKIPNAWLKELRAPVTAKKEGDPTSRAIKPAEVIGWKDYGAEVVVVLESGIKVRGPKPAEKKKS